MGCVCVEVTGIMYHICIDCCYASSTPVLLQLGVHQRLSIPHDLQAAVCSTQASYFMSTFVYYNGDVEYACEMKYVFKYCCR